LAFVMDRAFRLRDSPKWRPRWPAQVEVEKWGRHKRAEGSQKAKSCTRGARKRSALTATRASAETDKERTQYVAGDGPIENDRPGCDQELSIAQKRPHQSAARDALWRSGQPMPGSKAVLKERRRQVRSPLNTGHSASVAACRFCAKGRHCINA
jgi:hypothetical protein